MGERASCPRFISTLSGKRKREQGKKGDHTERPSRRAEKHGPVKPVGGQRITTHGELEGETQRKESNEPTPAEPNKDTKHAAGEDKNPQYNR